MTIKFEKDSILGKELKNWWDKLQDPNNRGMRAEFRRAKSVQEIIMLPSFYGSYNCFKRYFEKGYQWEDRLPIILGLLSHIKENNHEGLATQMAKSKSSSHPPVSVLRFRRLLQCNDRGELYIRMIRIIRLLNGKGNLYDIAQSCYFWNENTKRKWAFDYFSIVKE